MLILRKLQIQIPKYQIHLQAEVRNAQGQLIGIAETSRGNLHPT